MIIAFHGLPRSGKDTAADLLVSEFGFHKDSFGAGIYLELAAAFGVTVEQLQLHEWKTVPQPELALRNCNSDGFRFAAARTLLQQREVDEGLLYESPRTSRFLLQQWATEYRRAQDPLYWVNDLHTRLRPILAADNGADIVISDLREMHEMQYLWDASLLYHQQLRVIQVVRAGTVQSNHSSDAGIPAQYITTIIRNDELDEYLGNIRRTINNIRRKK